MITENQVPDVLLKRNLAENLKKARIIAGLSQLEMAKKLGYKTATAISLMESGKRGIDALDLWKAARLIDEDVNNFYLRGMLHKVICKTCGK